MQKNKQAQKSRWLEILIFVLFLNVFFFHSFGTVALVLFLSGCYFLAIRLFGKFELGTSTLFGISVLTMFLVNSPEKIILLTMFSVTVILTSVYRGLKGGPIFGILELGLSSLIVIREYVLSGFTILASALRGSLKDTIKLQYRPKERSPWIKSVFVGILVGLPAVAWLVMTLSKADPVFATFIKDLFSEKFLTDLPSRFVLSILTLFFLAPIVIMKWRGYVSPLSWITKVRFGREMTVILTMLTIVLGLFLVIQWPYIFASVAQETDLSKFGVATYSEYVQKGFWDLLKVAIMVFGVSWITLLISKHQKGNEQKILLGMQAILASEFVIFIVSIFRRVWLYQSYHGLTLARLYGLVLLTWLVGMMVTMGLRYLYQNVRFVKAEVAWIMFVIFGAILMNMESLIVKDPPTVNGRVDYVYLSRLSGDGYTGWKQAYEWADQVLAHNTENEGQIGKDDRRDIFYAGLITRELSRNYHGLIMQYGTDTDIQKYFKDVVAMRLKIATGLPMDGMISDELMKVREIQSSLDSDDWMDKADITPTFRMAPAWDYGFPNYKAHQADPYFYINNDSDSEILSGVDEFLAWDWSEQKVYERFNQEIGYQKILEMQKKHLVLVHRITGQPSEEQDFDIDISLDSPFLR